MNFTPITHGLPASVSIYIFYRSEFGSSGDNSCCFVLDFIKFIFCSKMVRLSKI